MTRQTAISAAYGVHVRSHDRDARPRIATIAEAISSFQLNLYEYSLNEGSWLEDGDNGG